MTTLPPIPATRIAGHRQACPCDGCAECRYRYQKRRLFGVARGTWPGMSDASLVRQVLTEYTDAAWTTRQMSFITGLDYQYIRALAGQHPTDPPPRKVRASTVRAVAKLAGADRLDPTIPDNSHVDPTGSLRRLRALAGLGWPSRVLQARYGWIVRPPGKAHTTAAAARAVRNAYNQLSTTRGPSQRTAVIAAEKCWALPLAWEFLDIDDPRTVPEPCSRTRWQRRPEDLIEDVEFIIRTTGASITETTARLGTTRHVLSEARKLIAAGAEAGAA